MLINKESLIHTKIAKDKIFKRFEQHRLHSTISKLYSEQELVFQDAVMEKIQEFISFDKVLNTFDVDQDELALRLIQRDFLPVPLFTVLSVPNHLKIVFHPENNDLEVFCRQTKVKLQKAKIPLAKNVLYDARFQEFFAQISTKFNLTEIRVISNE